MSDIKKQAKSPWNAFIPGAELFGAEIDTSKLPQVFKPGPGDKGEAANYNKILWGTLGSTLTLTGILGAAKVLANRYAESEWDKKKAEIHKNKVNALYSYNTPNTAPDVQAVKDVRDLAVAKKIEDEEEKPEGIILEPLPKAADGEFAAAVVPPLIALPTAFAIQSLFEKDVVENRRDELSEEIAKQRNKLDKLYARMLKLQSKSPVNKIASGPSLTDRFSAGYLLTTALLSSAVGYAAYYYTKKQDENRIKQKMLEKQLIPQNLTNVPATMDIEVSKSGKIPQTRSEQNYIEDLGKKVAEL